MKTTIERIIETYNRAADKFIEKVESGNAHSIETYADLKKARELARTLETAPADHSLYKC